MLMYKSVAWGGCLLVVAFLGACSSDKILPKGERIDVLTPVASIRPDVVNGASKVKVPAPVEISNWTQYDLNAQHLVPNAKLGTAFKKQWSTTFGKGKSKRDFLISRPLVVGNKVYTLDAQGLISAFNIKSGETLWSVVLKPQNKNMKDSALKGIGITYDKGKIFVVSGYGDVYALEAKSGKILWQVSLKSPLRIAPTLAKDKIFVQSVDNKFFALSVVDGSELWKYDISMESTTLVGGAQSAYSEDLDVVITGFSNGEIQAFNASIGSPLWSDVLISNRQAYSSTFLNTIKASPVIENGVVYAVGNSNVFTAIDIRSGQRRWEKEIGSVYTPLVVDNVVYLVSNTNDLVAFDKDNGNVLWATAIDLGSKPADVMIMAPVMIDSRLVVALSNGIVYSYLPQTGKVIGFENLNEELNSAPIVAGGYVFFVTADAGLIAYK